MQKQAFGGKKFTLDDFLFFEKKNPWDSITFPLLRKYTPSLLENDYFIPVQPLSAPSGLLFYLDYKK